MLSAEDRVRALGILRARAEAAASEKAACEASLIAFVEAAWPYIDSSTFEKNWAIEGLCLHLESVTRGGIRRFLANFPPRCSKTLITSVCWIAWTWIQQEKRVTSGPQVRFLCASYNHPLSLQNSNLTRRLITSPWFQSH